jgi:hypothetical protein
VAGVCRQSVRRSGTERPPNAAVCPFPFFLRVSVTCLHPSEYYVALHQIFPACHTIYATTAHPHPGQMTYEETAKNVIHFLHSRSFSDLGSFATPPFAITFSNAPIFYLYLGASRGRRSLDWSMVDRSGPGFGTEHDASETGISNGKRCSNSTTNSCCRDNRKDACSPRI